MNTEDLGPTYVRAQVHVPCTVPEGVAVTPINPIGVISLRLSDDT